MNVLPTFVEIVVILSLHLGLHVCVCTLADNFKHLHIVHCLTQVLMEWYTGKGIIPTTAVTLAANIIK